MSFLLGVIVLSVPVTAVSSVLWLFCFLVIATSRGEPVSGFFFTAMRNAGRGALVSIAVAVICVVIMAFFFRS